MSHQSLSEIQAEQRGLAPGLPGACPPFSALPLFQRTKRETGNVANAKETSPNRPNAFRNTGKSALSAGPGASSEILPLPTQWDR